MHLETWLSTSWSQNSFPLLLLLCSVSYLSLSLSLCLYVPLSFLVMFPHHSDQMSQSHLEAISFPRSSFACSVSRFHFSLVDAPVCMFINSIPISRLLFILCLQWSHLDPRRPFELGGGVPPAVTHILLLQPGDVRELQIYHIISIVAWNIVRKQVPPATWWSVTELSVSWQCS